MPARKHCKGRSLGPTVTPDLVWVDDESHNYFDELLELEGTVVLETPAPLPISAAIGTNHTNSTLPPAARAQRPKLIVAGLVRSAVPGACAALAFYASRHPTSSNKTTRDRKSTRTATARRRCHYQTIYFSATVPRCRTQRCQLFK